MDRLVTWFDRLQRRSRTAQYVLAVWRKFCDDQAGSLAAQMAYYAFLAVFPLLLVLVTVLGIVLHDDPPAQQWILHSALVDFPIIGAQLRSNVQSLGRSGTGLSIGLTGTVLGARGLTMATQRAFNTAWAVPFSHRPSFIGRQLRALGLLGIVAIAVITTGALSSTASIGGQRGWSIRAAALVVSAALNVGFFLLGFRVATAREVPTRSFLRTAVVAALGWQVLLIVGSYLIAHELRHTEEVYGLFGLVLGLVAWLHIQTQLTLLVLEADVVRVRGLWPRALTSDFPLEAGDIPALTSYATTQQRRRDMSITVSCDLSRVAPRSASDAAPAPDSVRERGLPEPGSAPGADSPAPRSETRSDATRAADPARPRR
jgi:membrane protein